MVALILLALFVLWSPPAYGSPAFPAEVDKQLGLTGDMVIEKHIDPTTGCLLCHVVEQGGNGTNNAFGLEMKQAGVVGTETQTIGPALAQLAQENPRAIQDIRSGINPNDDPLATSGRPVPQYGCGSVAGALDGSAWGGGIAAAAGLALARRRRGRTNASRAARTRR
jgi:hypothetical protein